MSPNVKNVNAWNGVLRILNNLPRQERPYPFLRDGVVGFFRIVILS
jgi:hypothetical protein